MFSILATSSILLWIVVLLNLILTIALIRRFNHLSTQMSTFPDIAEFSDMDKGLEVGSPAPDFQAETLSGETITLADYTRKAVSFVFFSPDCGPCMDKMSALNALAPKAQQAGVEMVLVNTDGNKEGTESFVQEHGVKLPVLLAPFESNSFAQDYKAMGTPFFCMLNRDGEVEATGGFGPKWDQLTQAWATA